MVDLIFNIKQLLYTRWGFLGSDSGTSQHEIEMQAKYYNIPLDILADGKSMNDVSFNMSWATGISFNFYF